MFFLTGSILHSNNTDYFKSWASVCFSLFGFFFLKYYVRECFGCFGKITLNGYLAVWVHQMFQTSKTSSRLSQYVGYGYESVYGIRVLLKLGNLTPKYL